MDYKTLNKKYYGKWVAFAPETKKVIGSGVTAKEAFTKAKDKGINIPTLLKVPTKYLPYIG